MRVLFLTWDGPRQSYLESLFFPVFVGLKARGIEVHTLQLTWARAAELEAVRSAAQRLDTPYASWQFPRAVRTLALPALVACGAAAAKRYCATHRIDTLLPRSLIPMAMGLLVGRARPGLDLAFEADGFMADERLDFGGWSERGAPYRLLRWIEANGVLQARAVICRTEAARRILISRAGGSEAALGSKIFVAPNAKDATQFAPGTDEQRASTRRHYGIEPNVPWIVYVGSMGPQYCPDLMLETFARIRARMPEAKLSCFTAYGRQMTALLERHGFPSGTVRVQVAAPAEVPAILAACDLGFALRLECPSQRGICPIKVAEYLLCGLPLVTSRVGDLEAQLANNPAALVVDSAAVDAPETVASWFVDSVLPRRRELRDEARNLGLKWFELSHAVDTYARMLRYGAELRSS